MLRSPRLLAMFSIAVNTANFAAAQSETALAEQLDLARLVDLAASRVGAVVEYDPARVQGRVTLRGQASLGDAGLWAVANRSLASRGLTTVRAPGDETLVVVPIGEAAIMARVEQFEDVVGETRPDQAGFRTVLYHTRHVESAGVLEGIRAYLTRGGGAASQVGESGSLVISDLSPKLEQIWRVLERLDQPRDDALVAFYSPMHVDAATLAARCMEARDKALELGLGGPRGQVMAAEGQHEVTILGPQADRERWERLLQQLDRAAPIETIVYSPESFPLNEVAALIEGVVGGSPRAIEPIPNASWSLVQDTLTNSLVITATSVQHGRVRELLARLAATPASERRVARYFTIRHRAAGEVLEVLQGLLDQSIAEGGMNRSRLDPVELAAQRGEVRVEAVNEFQGTAGGLGDSAMVDGRSDAGHVAHELAVVLATDEATNTLIALGEPRMIAQIEDLLRTIDVRQPQVMLEVVLVSLSDAQTRSLGVEMAGLIKTGEVRVRLASLFGLSTIGNGLPGGGVGGAGGTASVLAPEDFAIVLRALETINHGRSLSNPRVLVGNGQQASLNSTLGQPVTSVNASDTVATTSFAGFSDAGTQVSITPRIAAGDHLLLEYSITLSAFVGESPGAGIPPPRQQNQLQSVVSIPDGYTVVVGGIELATEGESENRVPLLGQIPIVREAFRSRNWNENRQRFFVFIRAEVDRGRSFEGLRHVSEDAMEEAAVADWPLVEPRIVR